MITCGLDGSTGQEIVNQINENETQIQTKEPSLGTSPNGAVLKSTGETRNWGFIFWGEIQGTLSSQPDLWNELQDRYLKSDFIETSSGSADAGKPIILNTDGEIDSSMLDVSSFHYVEDFTPVSGAEYPDNTGETPGAFWVIQGLSTDYTFEGGDLQGKTVSNNDYMVWGTNVWSIIKAQLDPELFYRLDGSNAITAPFSGGNQQLKNVADGTDNTDAATLNQVVKKTGGVFTGDVTIGDGVSGRTLNVRTIDGQNAAIKLKQPDNANGASILWDFTNGDLLLRRFTSAISHETARLDSTGNISVTGIEPENADHLTRKDYVDTSITEIESKLLGVNQTWASYLEERDLGGEYTNNTGRPITVAVRGETQGTVGQGLTCTVNNIMVARAETFADAYDTTVANFIVPSGSVYKVFTDSSIQLKMWNELR